MNIFPEPNLKKTLELKLRRFSGNSINDYFLSISSKQKELRSNISGKFHLDCFRLIIYSEKYGTLNIEKNCLT